MSDPSKIAMRHLEQVLSRDPLLRDVLEQTVPKQRRAGKFTPDIDVIETPERYVILVEVPGVPQETLRVELEGSKLLVRGQKPSGHPEGGAVHTAERGSGPFQREFLLPSTVDGTGVVADLKDGVLTVTVPRTGVGKVRRIPVKAES